MKRKRGVGGKFLKKAELEALAKEDSAKNIIEAEAVETKADVADTVVQDIPDDKKRTDKDADPPQDVQMPRYPLLMPREPLTLDLPGLTDQSIPIVAAPSDGLGLSGFPIGFAESPWLVSSHPMQQLYQRQRYHAIHEQQKLAQQVHMQQMSMRMVANGLRPPSEGSQPVSDVEGTAALQRIQQAQLGFCPSSSSSSFSKFTHHSETDSNTEDSTSQDTSKNSSSESAAERGDTPSPRSRKKSGMYQIGEHNQRCDLAALADQAACETPTEI
jgi:hypothetical protein